MWLLQQQSGIAVQSTFGPTDVRPVMVPAFEAEPGLQWSSSREEYDAARADERYAFEQFTCKSEGLTVGAYLYRPRKRSASPLPVIVYNRGSYTRLNGFAGEMLVIRRVLDAHRSAGKGRGLAQKQPTCARDRVHWYWGSPRSRRTQPIRMSLLASAFEIESNSYFPSKLKPILKMGPAPRGSPARKPCVL
jgi:hypothetical protein